MSDWLSLSSIKLALLALLNVVDLFLMTINPFYNIFLTTSFTNRRSKIFIRSVSDSNDLIKLKKELKIENKFQDL